MENTNQDYGSESLGENLCCAVVNVEPCLNEEQNGSIGLELMAEGEEPCVNEKHEIVGSSAMDVIDTCEEDVLEPYVGMEFESMEAARSFYNNYARFSGFSVRTGRSERAKRVGEYIRRYYYCSKEGFREKKYIERENRIMPMKPITREGCKAMIMITKRKEKWVLTRFEKNHNHPLMSPHEVDLLRSKRRGTNTAKNPMSTYRKAKIPPANIYSGFAEEVGGISNVGFIKNCYNSLGIARKKALEKGDAQSVLDYLKRMQAENPTFFYAIQVDEQERMTNFFWIDARSRMSYKYFGDVVSFDTTYKKNQYQMPFAPFTGVNHHRQPILFGCAFLLDETEASFVWLFKTWLVAMSERHPTSIITDQDAAITKAVAQVFPGSCHRLCMWHIKGEVPEKLGHVYHKHADFKDDFYECINLSETVDQFESSWRELIENYDLANDKWLQSLYKTREKWIPAFLRDTFFAGMSTTQRSESMSSYFDGYVNSSTTPLEFVTRYDKALDFRYNSECEEDFKTLYTKPIMKTMLLMEEQMAEIYSRKMFAEFQDELCASLRYVAVITNDDGVLQSYRVEKFGEERSHIGSSKKRKERSHNVAFHSSETKVTCSCKLFEFMGILCRHAHMVLRLRNILILPSYYIMDRWTRNAKHRAVYDDCMQANSQESSTLWYNDLCRQAIELAIEGAASLETYKAACSGLQRSLIEVREKQKNAPIATSSIEGFQKENISQAKDSTSQVTLHDPQCATSKGCSKGTRLKSRLEIGQKKNRKRSSKKSTAYGSSIDNPTSQSCMDGLLTPPSENINIHGNGAYNDVFNQGEDCADLHL